MKFTKLSLITALALTSVFAEESTITGDAKLFYGTTDAGTSDLFNKNGAMGNGAVSLDYSKNIVDGITLNAGMTGITTLGLEGTLVNNVWAAAGPTALNDTAWIDVANITANLGNTTAVIGRQKLDTPLAFTETWNIVENTFDAFTFVNNDIIDTTLVASLVTRANGNSMANFNNIQGGMTDLGDGIYTAGMVTKLIPNATTQLWYYNHANNDDKLWVQIDANVIEGVTVGAQYAQVMANTGDDSSVVAAKLAYDANGIGLHAAYSKANDDGTGHFANYAGHGNYRGANAGNISSLYTEALWNFGLVSKPGAEAVAVGASTNMLGLEFAAQYTDVTNSSNLATDEMSEIAFSASKNIAGINASLAFINTASDHSAIDGNTVQAFLTLPFSL